MRKACTSACPLSIRMCWKPSATTGDLSKETEEALRAALDAYTKDFLKSKK